MNGRRKKADCCLFNGEHGIKTPFVQHSWHIFGEPSQRQANPKSFQDHNWADSCTFYRRNSGGLLPTD
ncbi:hypothetical protein EG68_10040 [Paragonimus skrjabini miyazakii]|uniref:Uncharacterized protein n=1 Tax=Paragonimus skrjabini miyazakii TaxID=59628 RepID=A0A8S9YGY2_9TREM|nr:hypothetical protein EG68_10040 [Paragonimus skrjabini miyazakii]